MYILYFRLNNNFQEKVCACVMHFQVELIFNALFDVFKNLQIIYRSTLKKLNTILLIGGFSERDFI